ncbi:hypothetical protein LJR013_000935 [Pseudarthrobacter oxydans]|uniref:hypothetical protein n=1 Tax=Pseudarthrobacter oxydans TaxID=1671 RepID=UPI003ECDF655
MTNRDGGVAGSCHEPVLGDAVEAYSDEGLVHRGPVVDAIPDCGLLWILDTLTGSWQLIDMSELHVVRIPAPVVRPSFGRFLPKKARPAADSGTPSFNWRDVSSRGNSITRMRGPFARGLR